jgi:CubicO group peptidase (beta-lactamase class C family)
MIAGYIIELVSGKLYADYIQRHIFDVLEMSNSRALSGSAEVPRLTPGYLNYFGFKAPYNNAGQMPSAGRIIGTVLLLPNSYKKAGSQRPKNDSSHGRNVPFSLKVQQSQHQKEKGAARAHGGV